VIIPPTGNETISMLKTSSLVVVIGLFDLLGASQNIYNQASFLQIPLLVVASVWYLIMTSVLSIGQYFLERRFGRGSTRTTVQRPGARMLAALAAQRRDQSGGAAGA
jgi:polar amino acid transport system permease protein